MNTTNNLPLSGYSIEKIYANDLVLQHKAPSGEGGEISFSWDWRVAGADAFEVLLMVRVGASQKREEHFHAAIVGLFRQKVATPTVSLLDFVKLQAPAILLPYVRQLLSLLTTHSFYGTYYLPPVNMVQVMADFVPEHAEGARQLATGATISAGAGDRTLAAGANEVPIPQKRTKKGAPKAHKSGPKK